MSNWPEFVNWKALPNKTPSTLKELVRNIIFRANFGFWGIHINEFRSFIPVSAELFDALGTPDVEYVGTQDDDRVVIYDFDFVLEDDKYGLNPMRRADVCAITNADTECFMVMLTIRYMNYVTLDPTFRHDLPSYSIYEAVKYNGEEYYISGIYGTLPPHMVQYAIQSDKLLKAYPRVKAIDLQPATKSDSAVFWVT